MPRNNELIGQLDWLTIGLFVVLLFCGWLSVCCAGFSFDEATFFDFSTRSGRQLVWIGSSLILGTILFSLSSNFYRSYAWVFYLTMIALLIVTIFIAPDTKGSRSWLKFGPLSVQPAEFAKAAAALALARYIDGFKLKPIDSKGILKATVIFIIPMLIIVGQKETGTALVFLAFFIVLYREGMRGLALFSGFCAVLFFVIGIKYWNEPFGKMPFSTGPFIVLLLIQLFSAIMAWLYTKDVKTGLFTAVIGIGSTIIGVGVATLIMPFNVTIVQIASIAVLAIYMLFQTFFNKHMECIAVVVFSLGFTAFLYSCNFMFDNVLQEHQQTRINVILGVEDDPFGAGYNVNQSKIAIGSGGLSGKGFLKGTQTKLKYVPEQDTDFIFCTVGEEQGFIGSTFVILLFVTFLLRLLFLAERQSSVFGRVFGYSVVSILFFHFFINIGMVLGITPVIGIPLPFFSYGGSSLCGFTIMLSVFLRIDAERTSRY